MLTDTQTDRHTDRQTHRQTDTHTQTHTDEYSIGPDFTKSTESTRILIILLTVIPVEHLCRVSL